MINSFLVSLVNESAQPVNPSSTTGNILWPDAVQIQTFTGEARIAEQYLFRGQTGYQKLALAIHLLWLVEASPVAGQITADDARLSYNNAQLLGQLAGTAWNDHVSQLLAAPIFALSGEFLPDYLRAVYRGALSKTDRLASLAAYFGRRHV